MRPGLIRPGNDALITVLNEAFALQRASMRPGLIRPGNPNASETDPLIQVSLQ